MYRQKIAAIERVCIQLCPGSGSGGSSKKARVEEAWVGDIHLTVTNGRSLANAAVRSAPTTGGD